MIITVQTPTGRRHELTTELVVHPSPGDSIRVGDTGSEYRLVERLPDGSWSAIPHYRECDEIAHWVRRTQFSGDHYFCVWHARIKEDFSRTHDLTHFFWEEIHRVVV